MKFILIGLLTLTLTTEITIRDNSKFPDFKQFTYWKDNFNFEVGKLDIKSDDIMFIKLNNDVKPEDLEYLDVVVNLLRKAHYRNFLIFLRPGYTMGKLSDQDMNKIVEGYVRVKGWKIVK